jgi:hypothetical protein
MLLMDSEQTLLPFLKFLILRFKQQNSVLEHLLSDFKLLKHMLFNALGRLHTIEKQLVHGGT